MYKYLRKLICPRTAPVRSRKTLLQTPYLIPVLCSHQVCVSKESGLLYLATHFDHRFLLVWSLAHCCVHVSFQGENFLKQLRSQATAKCSHILLRNKNKKNISKWWKDWKPCKIVENKLHLCGCYLESKAWASLVADRVPFWQLVCMAPAAGSELANVSMQDVVTQRQPPCSLLSQIQPTSPPTLLTWVHVVEDTIVC